MSDKPTDAAGTAVKMRRYLSEAEDNLVQAAGALMSAACEASNYLHGEGSQLRTDRHLLLEAAEEADRLHHAIRRLVEGHRGLGALQYEVESVIAADGHLLQLM